jgi:diaminopimelate epimerase
MRNGFFKAHCLGNDYLVLDPDELDFRLTPSRIRLLCDRRRGIGADGVLVPSSTARADHGLRIFNPDGSEAERSGNGLRIFACYLFATRRTRRAAFRIDTRGGVVAAALELGAAGEVVGATIEMGRASFSPKRLPCSLKAKELVDRTLRVAGGTQRFTGVSVGNPHCVLFRDAGEPWTPEEARTLGPLLERHRIFPRRCNVQFAVPTGPRSLFIRIWERGAGETQASGTSACAAACAAVRLALVSSPVRVDSPGGSMRVVVTGDFDVTLTGPVAEIARGRLSPSFLSVLG